MGAQNAEVIIRTEEQEKILALESELKRLQVAFLQQEIELANLKLYYLTKQG